MRPAPDTAAAVDLDFVDRARGLAGVGAPWAVGCLVEGPDGRLLTHRLDEVAAVPAAVVATVLAGDLQPLDRALQRRRTLGLVSSGAVVVSTVQEPALTVVRLPLRTSNAPLGAVWLLVQGDPPPLVDLETVATRATRLLLQGPPEVPPLLWCLDGHADSRLPATLARCSSLWVAALVGGPEVLTGVHQQVQASGLVAESCARGLTSYVVLGAGLRTTTSHVQTLLRSAVQGRAWRAGLSSPAPATGLGQARAQADLALRAAEPGRLVSLDESRSTLVLRHLADGFATLPDLGPDPLELLRHYDERRSAQLTWTLRCWLDSGRDLAATTAVLSIHANTLRYRLQRIEQVMGVDLRRDTAAALEMHLRLRTQSQPQLSLSTTSTGS